ncbi:hypothetical protein JMM59_17905 [Rhodovulum sulfidophilum]|uniref:hypothetical protein n=1 Tax=Rhodovulum sulfidophilum TaxID=35806 RepID=UPI001921F253|nr:hypothetical protein [Rhodovulum sulfidophilum]MBL3566870.1 hypothetical protein [Rhodovulum sulfidophilum]
MDTSWVENEKGEFPGDPAKGCMYRACDTAGEKISDKIGDKAGQKPDGKATGRGLFCAPLRRIAEALSARRARGGRAASAAFGRWPKTSGCAGSLKAPAIFHTLSSSR